MLTKNEMRWTLGRLGSAVKLQVAAMNYTDHLTLRETANLIGQKLFAPSFWKETILDHPDSERYARVEEKVRDLIASEKVKVWYSGFDAFGTPFVRLLDFTSTQHEFFSLNLKSNCLDPGIPAEPVELKFHKIQTKEYVAAISPFTGNRKDIRSDEYYTTLVEWFGAHTEPRTRDQQYEALKNEYGHLSSLAFKKLRKDAIAETGRHDLEKPGRPKETD